MIFSHALVGKVSLLLGLPVGAVLLLGACSGGTTGPQMQVDELVEALTFNLAVEPDEAVVLFAEQQRLVEEATAECMAAAGFEWVPIPPPPGSLFESGTDGPSLGSREWAEEYGLGLTTRRFPQQFVGPNLKGIEDLGDDFVDPNAEYLATLSLAARAEYDLQLQGDTDRVGCQDEAWSASQQLRRYTAIQTEFGPSLAEAVTATFSDRRVVAAEEQMTACVSEAGYASGPDLLADEFEVRLEPIQDELAAGSATLSTSGQELLEMVQSLEIDLAITMLDCREEVGYSDLIDTVYRENLATFAEANRAALSSALAEADAAR